MRLILELREPFCQNLAASTAAKLNGIVNEFAELSGFGNKDIPLES